MSLGEGDFPPNLNGLVTYAQDDFDLVHVELLVEHVVLSVTGGPEFSLAGGGIVDAFFRLLFFNFDRFFDLKSPLVLNELKRLEFHGVQSLAMLTELRIGSEAIRNESQILSLILTTALTSDSTSSGLLMTSSSVMPAGISGTVMVTLP